MPSFEGRKRRMASAGACRVGGAVVAMFEHLPSTVLQFRLSRLVPNNLYVSISGGGWALEAPADAKKAVFPSCFYVICIGTGPYGFNARSSGDSKIVVLLEVFHRLAGCVSILRRGAGACGFAVHCIGRKVCSCGLCRVSGRLVLPHQCVLPQWRSELGKSIPLSVRLIARTARQL